MREGWGTYLHFDGIDEVLFLVDPDLSVSESNQHSPEPPGTMVHKLQRGYGLRQLHTPQRLALYGKEGGREREGSRS